MDSDQERASYLEGLNEDSPMLTYSEDGDIDCKQNAEGASTASAVFNLSTSIIGAGIMGLPSKMKVMGLPCGLIMLLIMGILTESSIEMLLACSIVARAKSYADLMSVSSGQFARGIKTLCLMINNIGLLIIYLIIIGSGDDYPGVMVTWAGGLTWWNSRSCVITFTLIFVISPLVAFENFDSLKVSSALSILLAIVFVVVTTALFIFKAITNSIDYSDINLLPQISSVEDIMDIFSVIPTMCTAYVCHYNVHPIYAELAQPRAKRMKMAVRASLILCTSVYCITGLSGYMLFGDNTMSDVLANFNTDLGVSYGQVIADVVRVSYAVHLMLVFPVIHFAVRLNLDLVLFPKLRPMEEDKVRYAWLTITVLTMVLFSAIFIPSIDIVFDVIGSLAAATLAFTLPGLAGWKFYSHGVKYAMAVMFVIIGILVTFTGVLSSIWDLIA